MIDCVDESDEEDCDTEHESSCDDINITIDGQTFTRDGSYNGQGKV